MWQSIYVATWKEPTKCLYNVVELFIFKFLSDLEVLDEDLRIDKVYEKCLKNENDGLEYYAEIVRPKIRKLFPSKQESGTWIDNTTIINWTIFVNALGKPVFNTSKLFKNSIKSYNEFWDLTKVQKELTKISLYLK